MSTNFFNVLNVDRLWILSWNFSTKLFWPFITIKMLMDFFQQNWMDDLWLWRMKDLALLWISWSRRLTTQCLPSIAQSNGLRNFIEGNHLFSCWDCRYSVAKDAWVLVISLVAILWLLWSTSERPGNLGLRHFSLAVTMRSKALT